LIQGVGDALPSPASSSATPREFLFLVDPPAQLKAHKDSSIAMMRELARRGHSIWACTPQDLTWAHDMVSASASPIVLRPAGTHPWFEAQPGGRRPLAQFAAVLMRKDPPFDSEYLYTTHLLQAAARGGARVFNAPAALRDHNEKLAITEFPDFIAPTLVSSQPQEILAFQREQGEIVVKPLDGMGGSGIFRLHPGDPNTNVILETATREGAQTVMAQRYLPQISQGDKRILLIGGHAVPYALARIPKPGESRGNLAAGGTGRAQELDYRDRQIAEALGPILERRGLLLVGLDVIGECLTEINVTSPTCFVEIQEQTGFDVAATFVDSLEQRLRG